MGSVQVRKLESLDWEDFRRLGAGYTSTRKYIVEKTETRHKIVVTLTLGALAGPYVKSFPLPTHETKRYEQIIQQGLSLGAYDGGRLVGAAIAERRDWNRSLWLWELVVDENRRGMGVGRQLIETLASLAKQSGFRVIALETQNTNVPAIEFYRKTGFEIEGIDLSYYTNTDMPTGEVAIFMKRKLE